MCIHMSYSLVAQRDSTGDADGCGGEGVELERGRGGGPRFCEIYARSTRDLREIAASVNQHIGGSVLLLQIPWRWPHLRSKYS